MTLRLQRLPLVALLPALLACSVDETPSSAPDALAPPDGLGTLVVSLKDNPALASSLSVLLALDRTAPAEDAESDVVVREFPLSGAATVLHTVYLEPGTYTIRLELRSPLDEVVLSGVKPNVTISLGRITSVTVPLEASGGVQVAARIVTGGKRFEFVESVDQSPNSVYWITGTQREVSDGLGGTKTEYMALIRVDSSTYQIRADSPAGLMVDDPSAVGPNITMLPIPAYSTPPGVAVVGEDLYVASVTNGVRIDIHRIHDGFAEEYAQIEVSTEPVATYTWITRPDRLQACQLVVDNQFNLFCNVRRWVSLPGHQSEQRHAIVYAHSTDGRFWSDLVPYDFSLTDWEAEKVPVEFGDTEVFAWPEEKLPPIASILDVPTPAYYFNFHVMLDGAAYRLWSAETDVHRQQSHLRYSASTDRQEWSHFAPLETANKDQFGVKGVKGMAVYRTPSGYEMLISTLGYVIARAVSVD